MRDYSVSSVKKAVRIIDYIKLNKNATFSDIVNDLKLPKSSAYELLRTLADEHIVRENQYGEYFLSYKLYDWGESFSSSISWRELVSPYLKKLNEDLGFMAHLCIMTDDAGMCIEKLPGKVFTTTFTAVGRPLNLNASASGKTLLAWQPEKKQDEIISKMEFVRFTEHTITNAEDLKKELKIIRQRGYSVDNRETDDIIRGLSVPLFACDGSLLASISIGAPSEAIPEESIETYIKMMLEYTKQLQPLLPPRSNL